MDDFRTMLKDISLRPSMYVGECSLNAVSNFIDGYCYALASLSPPQDPFTRWLDWIALRFLIFSPAWSWTRILIHVYGSDRAALDALPSLYEEYLVQCSLMSVQEMREEINKQLVTQVAT